MTHSLSTGWIGCIAAMRFPAAARGDAKNLISAFRGSLDATPRAQAMIAASFAKSLALALTVVLAIGLPNVAAAQPASFQGLGFLPDGSSGSWATGISSDGTVVVGYGAATGSSEYEAFSWTAGTMTGLGYLSGASQSRAWATNSNGTVIVGDSEPANSSTNGFIWSNGTMTAVSNPACAKGEILLGVNASATGPGSSVIAGQTGSSGCGPGIAVEWINQTWIDMFPNPISPCTTTSSGESYGVSADGSSVVGAVGYCYMSGQSIQASTGAFVYNNNSGSGTVIGPSGGVSSIAYAASSNGSVVVGTTDSSPGSPYQYAF